MGEDQIIKIAAEVAVQQTMDIIKWVVSIGSAIVIGIAGAVGALWKRSGKRDNERDIIVKEKDAEIKRLNAIITQQAKEQIQQYYEALKELAPFVEKSVDIQNKIYDLCDSTLKSIGVLESKYTSMDENIEELPRLLQDLKNDISTKLQLTRDDHLIIKTRLENALAAIESLLRNNGHE